MVKVTYGNRQAGVLCQLGLADRLDLIAQGLPVILASAEGFWTAASALAALPREARVLEGFAEEEASKVLILVDLVRCPPIRAATTLGRMIRTFYDHLARLIYAEAQAWKPTDVRQLRAYVDNARKGHYLEGYVGEHIIPNWNRYSREAAMYADVEVHEDGVPTWSQPHLFANPIPASTPLALTLARSRAYTGMFTRAGLQAVSDIWAEIEFTDSEHGEQNRPLVTRLLNRLDAEKLVTASANADHGRMLRSNWQMPMYDLDFRETAVPLEELQAGRAAQLRSEMGDPRDYA